MGTPFDGCVALVTGACGGIGTAVAVMLGGRGAKVMLTDLDSGPLNRVRTAVPGDCAALDADLTDRAVCRAVVDRTVEALGRLDILVNVAGDYTAAPIEEMSETAWQQMFDVNLKSTFEMMVAAIGPMRRQGRGWIVNVASVDAYTPMPGLAHYAAAKAGVVSLTRTFALAYAPDGVLVNAVAPGPVATERALGEAWLEPYREQSPLGRVAEPEDIAEVIAFLASDANRCVTGETVIASSSLFYR
jgi:NAD(P)-dependent dehydrogenase (short-subunit alcohol dehydrogenase family)